MEELWNKLGAWGYAVPILMLLCLNILLFTDIFEKIIIRCWGYLENIIEKTKRKKILVIYVIFRIFFLFKS